MPHVLMSPGPFPCAATPHLTHTPFPPQTKRTQHMAAALRHAHAAMSSEAFSLSVDEEYHGELLALAQELAARAEAKASLSSQGPRAGAGEL